MDLGAGAATHKEGPQRIEKKFSGASGPPLGPYKTRYLANVGVSFQAIRGLGLDLETRGFEKSGPGATSDKN